MAIRVPRLGYGTGDQVQWLTAPGRTCKICRWEFHSLHFFLLRAEPYKPGPRRINGIFHRPSFVMGNSFCSVRDNHCCCSVHNGEGSRTSVDQKFDQVMKASPMTPWDVQDCSFSPDTTKDIPYELQSSVRKGGDAYEKIVIQESTMNIIMDRSESAFVSTRILADMEDALICDGGATSILTKSLENCTLGRYH